MFLFSFLRFFCVSVGFISRKNGHQGAQDGAKKVLWRKCAKMAETAFSLRKTAKINVSKTLLVFRRFTQDEKSHRHR